MDMRMEIMGSRVLDWALDPDPEQLDMPAALPRLSLLRNDRGGTEMLGMAVIGALIIVVAIAGLTPLGTGIRDEFLDICSSLTGSTCTATN